MDVWRVASVGALGAWRVEGFASAGFDCAAGADARPIGVGPTAFRRGSRRAGPRRARRFLGRSCGPASGDGAGAASVSQPDATAEPPRPQPAVFATPARFNSFDAAGRDAVGCSQRGQRACRPAEYRKPVDGDRRLNNPRAGHPAGGNTRGGPRPDRHPTQRGGQSQPVFLAWL
jgi:hypothetical protein